MVDGASREDDSEDEDDFDKVYGQITFSQEELQSWMSVRGPEDVGGDVDAVDTTPASVCDVIAADCSVAAVAGEPTANVAEDQVVTVAGTTSCKTITFNPPVSALNSSTVSISLVPSTDSDVVKYQMSWKPAPAESRPSGLPFDRGRT